MPLRLFLRYVVTTLVCATALACANRDHALQPLTFGADLRDDQLEALGRSLRDARIVLLGENGHGVGAFTEAKVQLVDWLHADHGFDVVIFESGFFECGHVWNRLDDLDARDALLQCLRYPFQHAELVPLFERIRALRDTDRPLALAGMDLQAQGFDSESRPATLRDVLDPIDADLAERVAAFDTALFLPSSVGGEGEAVYDWILEHGATARAAYESAATQTAGWERWVFALATGWIDRLTVRARAAAQGRDERPGRYYELRDEWMAKAVTVIADSLDGERKVVVWLHNDHGRYGNFAAGSHEIRSVGSFLRERHGDRVYSVGFFMGRGVIADNGRNEREVAVPEPGGVEGFLGAAGSSASYLVLRGNADATIRRWAGVPQSYLRMGVDPLRLVPAEEFDALIYVDSVGPPTYEIR